MFEYQAWVTQSETMSGLIDDKDGGILREYYPGGVPSL